jgi:adenine-specific DNA-methyltransferase
MQTHKKIDINPITYMGNKRKLVGYVDNVVDHVIDKLNKPTITFADPFSGSGVVSRHLLTSGKCRKIIANDIAGYSHVLNIDQLQPLRTPQLKSQLHTLIDTANSLPPPKKEDEWFATHWAPRDDTNIQLGERCYFTRENALIIDAIRNFIDTRAVPKQFRPYILASLIVQASIHNNTNGQFAAFYKDEDGIGCFGGKKHIDLKRITGRIILPYPTYHDCEIGECSTTLTQKDVLSWCRDINNSGNTETIDLVYLDPPYNKHPYNIYYFLLDIICIWDKSVIIPETYRGQPKNWIRSDFNSTVGAREAIWKLVKDVPAKFVALSYYSAGIVSVPEIDEMLAELGQVERHTIPHSTYKKLYGLGSYKREKEAEPTGCATEYLWVLRKNEYISEK